MVDGTLRSDVAVELTYRGLTQRLLKSLAVHDIPVMPLKGILFAYWLYDCPADRLGGDVDLLVPEDRFQQAIHVLARARFLPRFSYSNGRECTLTTPDVSV